MPRLVTGLFYERYEAERAVDSLRAQGVPMEDIYLEEEVTPTADIGRKGGEVSSLEAERRFAGLETGLVIGLTVGILAGIGVGMMGTAISEMMIRVDPKSHIAPLLTNPALTALCGALLGLITGGLIGWIVDYTLTRMGAGPPLPQQETLVTVRTDEGTMDQVYAMLHRAHARHLHVAERSAA